MTFFKCLDYQEILFLEDMIFGKQGLQSYSSYQLHEQCIKICDHVEFSYYVDLKSCFLGNNVMFLQGINFKNVGY